MKRHEFSTTGKVTDTGKLAIYMQEFNEFLKQHKGCTVVAKFRIVTPGTSEALRAYYYNCVVPAFKSAFWENGERMTEEQAEKRIRELSPVMYVQTVNEETGEYTGRIREISELDNDELVEHIETLKQIAAEDFSTYIEDPRNI